MADRVEWPRVGAIAQPRVGAIAQPRVGAIAQTLAPRTAPRVAAPAPPATESAPGFAFTLLPRHGARPLGFHGRLLVAAAVEEPGLPVTSRIALHETASGGLVAEIRHATCAPLAEATRCYAEAAPAEALRGFLEGHDPLRDLPADWLVQAAGDTDRAERLLAAAALAPRLRAAWRGLIAACFGPPEPASPRPGFDAADTDTETTAGDAA